MGQKAQPQVTTQQMTVDPMVSRMQQYTFNEGRKILEPRFRNPQDFIAGFNQDQTNAFQGVRDLQGGITPGDVQGWMNPYVSNVVDTTTSRMRQEADRNLAGIRARGAAGNAFGGMGARSAFAENRAMATNQQQMAEMTAKLMAQGYDQATATAITNQGLRSSATQALLGIGNQQQQQAQSVLDAPLKPLAIAQGLTPQQYSTTSTTTQPAPQQASPLQQALGLGLSVFGGPIGNAVGTQATNWMTGRVLPGYY
jgi:hypothetical protein